MPLEEIDLGSSANDGTGDTIRQALTKVQSNFETLDDEKLDASGGTATGATLTSPTINTPTITGATVSDFTASRAVVSGAAKQLTTSSVTSTELGYLSGVSSAIQTQLDAKIEAQNPTFTGSVTVTGDPETANDPALSVTQIWNNAAVAFTGMKVNVTNTNSAAGSALIDLQLDGSSKFILTKTGQLTAQADIIIPGTNQLIFGTGPQRARIGASASDRLQAYDSSGALGPFGAKRIISTLTGSATIDAALCGGAVAFNTGATALVVATLPAGSPGYWITFCVTDSDGISIKGNGAEQIRVGADLSTATTGDVQSANIGDSITLAWSGSVWFALNVVGNWTVN